MLRRVDWVRAYYYLVPLWAILELSVCPGWRARPVVGGSTPAVLGYYAMELGVAFAFWRGLTVAPKLALLDNVVQLVSTFRFILIGPLVAMSQIAEGAGGQGAAEGFVRAMPGALVSACILTYGFYRKLDAATKAEYPAPAPGQSAADPP